MWFTKLISFSFCWSSRYPLSFNLLQEQCCLLILDFFFRVLGFSLLISCVRAVYLLSLFIIFSGLPQPVLNDELFFAFFKSSGSLFWLSTVLTAKENFLTSAFACICISPCSPAAFNHLMTKVVFFNRKACSPRSQQSPSLLCNLERGKIPSYHAPYKFSLLRRKVMQNNSN